MFSSPFSWGFPLMKVPPQSNSSIMQWAISTGQPGPLELQSSVTWVSAKYKIWHNTAFPINQPFFSSIYSCNLVSCRCACLRNQTGGHQPPVYRRSSCHSGPGCHGFRRGGSLCCSKSISVCCQEQPSS